MPLASQKYAVMSAALADDRLGERLALNPHGLKMARRTGGAGRNSGQKAGLHKALLPIVFGPLLGALPQQLHGLGDCLVGLEAKCPLVTSLWTKRSRSSGK
jgi:hypothetical protein